MRKKISDNQYFTTYPNPADDYLDISIVDPSGSTLQLCTMQGEVLLVNACQANQRLDLSQLPAGSYLMTVASPICKTQRLVLKR